MQSVKLIVTWGLLSFSLVVLCWFLLSVAGDASEPTDMVEELPYLLSLKSSDAVLSKVPKA